MSNKYFIITIDVKDPTSGMYAIQDEDSTPMVQLFLNEDDAVCYNTQLEAIGQELYVVGMQDGDALIRLLEIMGYGFIIINPGEVVVPRIETMQSDLLNRISRK